MSGASARVRIGTRGSDLALWQARRVAARWLEATGEEPEVVIVRTHGDADQLSPLRVIGGAGAFTKELEQALLDETIDLAVHSLKDLPTQLDPRLCLAAIPERAACEDVLIARTDAVDPERMADGEAVPLRAGARLGSSSMRRRALVRAARTDLDLCEIRGNVPTRVDKVRRGEVDATILAAAGLERLALDLAGLFVRKLDAAEFVPAPGQGALAVEARAADAALIETCRRALHDEAAAEAVHAERAVLARLEGGCTVPLGTHARREPGGLVLWAALGTPEAAAALPATAAPAAANALAAAPLSRALVRAADGERAAALAFAALGGEATRAACAAAGANGESAGEAADVDLGALRGQVVAITRPAGRGDALAAALERLGATVRLAPAIETVRIAKADEVRSALEALPAGALVLLTSPVGASALADAFTDAGGASASLAPWCVGAVGASTAEALALSGVPIDLLGAGPGGAALADAALAWLDAHPDAPRVALLPSARDPRPELEEALARAGVEVRRLVLYETREVEGASYPVDATLALVASPSAARALGTPPALVGVIAIGHTTAASLWDLGIVPRAIAQEPSVTGQLAALARAAMASAPR